jgi:hypothetical protein
VSFAVVFAAMTVVAVLGLLLVRRLGPVPAPRS